MDKKSNHCSNLISHGGVVSFANEYLDKLNKEIKKRMENNKL